MADDLKGLTVSALKELARKYLGKGYSRLKTKADLLGALTKIVTHPQAADVTKFAKPAAPTASHGPRHLTAAVAAKTSEHAAPAQSPPKVHAKAIEEPRPVVEGFFVVRVAGSEEAERHHLTESSSAGERSPHSRGPVGYPAGYYDERLGDLPDAYEDDAELLLPRDPHTLFLLWDYSRDSRQTAIAGLKNPRARLRVFDEEQLVREIDVALESRSYYIHGLIPGRRYRVEAFFVGDGGEARRIARGSNVIALPREGPSNDLEVRFMRIPWDVPLSRVRELLRQFRETHPSVAPPARVPLPSSQTSRELTAAEKIPALGPAGARVSLPSSQTANGFSLPSSPERRPASRSGIS